MSESDIDIERPLIGIDDKNAWSPEITWINCADEMPPDEAVIIVRDNEIPKILSDDD